MGEVGRTPAALAEARASKPCRSEVTGTTHGSSSPQLALHVKEILMKSRLSKLSTDPAKAVARVPRTKPIRRSKYKIRRRPTKTHGIAIDLEYWYKGERFRPTLGYDLSDDEIDKAAAEMVLKIQEGPAKKAEETNISRWDDDDRIQAGLSRRTTRTSRRGLITQQVYGRWAQPWGVGKLAAWLATQRLPERSLYGKPEADAILAQHGVSRMPQRPGASNHRPPFAA